MDLALSMGWSKAGLQNLRPSSENWTIGMLINHRITHAPDVLDPFLKGQKECYALGLISSIPGYVPDDVLKAKRAKIVKPHGPKSYTNSVKKPERRGGGKSEGSRRSPSSSSEKSSVSDSKERKSRPVTSQKPSPPEGQGAKLSYGNSIYDLLESSNKSTLKKTVPDNCSRVHNHFWPIFQGGSEDAC